MKLQTIPSPRQYHRVTDTRIDLLLGWLEKGYSRRAAARLAGISWTHFMRLLNGTNGTSSGYSQADPEMTLRELVEEAEAAAQAAIECVVLSAVPKNPALALKLLERRYPKEWHDPLAMSRITETDHRSKLLEMEQRLAEIEEKMLRKQLESTSLSEQT
jgi:hypothetical protein